MVKVSVAPKIPSPVEETPAPIAEKIPPPVAEEISTSVAEEIPFLVAAFCYC